MEEERTLDPDELSHRGAYAVLLGPEAEVPALRVAAALRELLPVELDLTGRGMKAQLKTANARRARFALILGEDEIREGAVTVKDLDSGEQVSLKETEMMEFMRKIAS